MPIVWPMCCPASRIFTIRPLTYFCNKVRHDFENAFAFVYEENLVVLFNLNRINDRQKFFDRFNAFIKESNFKVGFSNDAKGLGSLSDCYQEARIALDLGSRTSPEKDICQFGDYVLAHLLSQMTRVLPAKNLNAPILSRLNDYFNFYTFNL